MKSQRGDDKHGVGKRLHQNPYFFFIVTGFGSHEVSTRTRAHLVIAEQTAERLQLSVTERRPACAHQVPVQPVEDVCTHKLKQRNCGFGCEADSQNLHLVLEKCRGTGSARNHSARL
jgi:hypothetical protein